MLDDGPADLALQEYEDKIINTLEEITANGLSPRALIIRSFSSNLSTPTKLASETENLSTRLANADKIIRGILAKNTENIAFFVDLFFKNFFCQKVLSYLLNRHYPS
jgi:hypothetical protein